ncbi:hypothetical protein X801_04115 [Opisthorchis viverrini]|uniref:Deacetylase sirtuin-type domain-containing protein n=1 Tax=Opisthorchis viverrini TaxID=6198 RepID=A0A1S8X039_OPIVI|nr:hypothetical protein X801_04115 [Opisthorchis viverrini]
MNDKIPKCQANSCDGVVKPGLSLPNLAPPLHNFRYCFLRRSLTRQVPYKRWSALFFPPASVQDFSVCDLLIIIGTSLTVMPFCMLVDKVGAGVPRLYINREVPEMGLEELLDMKRSIDATLGEVAAKRAGTEKNRIENEPRK